jgi:xyloglucan-specific endo-beta-1,4-glucanase
MKILLSLIALASAVNAAPTIELEPRGSYKQFCGQWDSTTFSIANSDASYIVYNNLWGESSAQSGSQCTTVTSISGNEIAWKTNWSWEGSSSKVKSYANVAYQYTPKQLSAISKISTKWTWGLVFSFNYYSLTWLF